ncbi:MAG: LON peptidase substrate-binding domain-containing protein [Candidatus Acidiferrales bacterium]
MPAMRIPRFPLEIVLLPRMELPLHIFEPRYKQMIGRCIEGGLEFGVILAKENAIVPVGCTAEIIQVIRKHEDGRMDIRTIGKTPFQVLKIIQEQLYLEAEIEYLEDAAGLPESKVTVKLEQLYTKCHELVYGNAPEILEVPEGASTAYQIAAELPLDLEAKQFLLQLRGEDERQRELIERLERWLPQLEHLRHVREKSRGNGHGAA